MKQSILVCLLLSLAAVLVTACGPAASAAPSAVGVSDIGNGGADAVQISPESPADAGSGPRFMTTSPSNSNAGYPGQAARDAGGAWGKPGTISVTGQGQVSAAPDLATLRLGTESIADTVQAARTASATATQGMIDALLELEVAERDIGTSSVNISTVFDYDAQTVTGYRVSNRLTVRIRDLSAIGTVIDRVTDAGGDLTRLQGVSFAVEDTTALEEQARAAAVADLIDKADQLAELLKVKVGPAISIAERDGGFQPFRDSFQEYAVAAAIMVNESTPVLAGEVQVTVALDAVFAIAEPEGS